MAKWIDGETDISNVWGTFKTQLSNYLSGMNSNINDIAKTTPMALNTGAIYRDLVLDSLGGTTSGGSKYVFNKLLCGHDNKLYYLASTTGNNPTYMVLYIDLQDKTKHIYCANVGAYLAVANFGVNGALYGFYKENYSSNLDVYRIENNNVSSVSCASSDHRDAPLAIIALGDAEQTILACRKVNHAYAVDRWQFETASREETNFSDGLLIAGVASSSYQRDLLTYQSISNEGTTKYKLYFGNLVWNDIAMPSSYSSLPRNYGGYNNGMFVRESCSLSGFCASIYDPSDSPYVLLCDVVNLNCIYAVNSSDRFNVDIDKSRARYMIFNGNLYVYSDLSDSLWCIPLVEVGS